jgi:starch-binding outer membrane protein SusE/F
MKKNLYKIGCMALAIGLITLGSCKKEKSDRGVLLTDVPGAVLSVDSLYNNQIDLNTPYDSTAKISWTAPSFGKDVKTASELQFASSEARLGTETDAFSFKMPTGKLNYTIVDKPFLSNFQNLVAAGDSVFVYMRVKSYPAYNPKAGFTYSNVKKVMMVRTAPALPKNGELFIVGDGSLVGWNNPVPAPDYKLIKYSDTWYGGRFYLNGGKSFLLLPENGSWDSKYCLFDGEGAQAGISNGGGFIFRTSGGDNFQTPAASGWYKLSYNFSTMEFSIVNDDAANIPVQSADLYVTGEAVPSSWTPTPPADQKMVRVNANQYYYDGTFDSEKLMKVLTGNGAWQPQYGQEPGKDGGVIGINGSAEPDVIKTPKEAGSYRFMMDFSTGKYSFTKN